MTPGEEPETIERCAGCGVAVPGGSSGCQAIMDEILARDPNALPGATSNHCYFCWYVLTRGLADGVPGGGGQVGAWTGTRPNHAGELVQLGVQTLAKSSAS